VDNVICLKCLVTFIKVSGLRAYHNRWKLTKYLFIYLVALGLMVKLLAMKLTETPTDL